MSESWESSVSRRLHGAHRAAPAASPDPAAAPVQPVVRVATSPEPAAATPHRMADRFAEASAWNADRRRGLRRLRSTYSSDDVPGVMTRATTVLQRPVATGRRVVWAGVAGGAGTTTTAYAVAALMAALRGDGTAVLGAPRDRMGLAWRAAADAVVSVPGLWTGDATPAHLEDLAEIPCLAVPHPDDAATAARAALTLSRHRSYVMVDSGTAPEFEVASAAHCVVLVAPATAAAVDVLAGFVDDLAEAEVAARTRVVVVDTIARPLVSAVDVAATLRKVPFDVDVIPHDEHLAAGARIDPALVSEETRVALARLAAGIVDVATGGVHPPETGRPS